MFPVYPQLSCQHHIATPQQKAGSKILPVVKQTVAFCSVMLCPNLIEHWTKQSCVSLVSNSLHQRDIDRVTQTFTLSNLLIRPCAWRKPFDGGFLHDLSTWKEALAIAMEWKSKNPVCVEESLLYSITMVDVYVDVQHTSMMFQQL